MNPDHPVGDGLDAIAAILKAGDVKPVASPGQVEAAPTREDMARRLYHVIYRGVDFDGLGEASLEEWLAVADAVLALLSDREAELRARLAEREAMVTALRATILAGAPSGMEYSIREGREPLTDRAKWWRSYAAPMLADSASVAAAHDAAVRKAALEEAARLVEHGPPGAFGSKALAAAVRALAAEPRT